MRVPLFLLLLIVLTAGAAVKAQQVSVEVQSVNWYKDIKVAGAAARESGKPMLIDFTASWCKPCHAMDASFWPRPEIVKLSEKFVCVRLDYDEKKSLAEKYGVHGIPNVLVTDSWGLLLFSNLGFGTRRDEDLVKKMNLAPQSFAELIPAGLLLDKEDAGALKTFADFYQTKGFYYQSNTFLNQLLKDEKDAIKRAEFMLRIGFNYLRIESFDEALDIFDKFRKELPAAPQMEGVLYGQTVAYAKKGKTKNAQKSLEQLKAGFPDSTLIAQAEKAISEPAAAAK